MYLTLQFSNLHPIKNTWTTKIINKKLLQWNQYPLLDLIVQKQTNYIKPFCRVEESSTTLAFLIIIIVTFTISLNFTSYVMRFEEGFNILRKKKMFLKRKPSHSFSDFCWSYILKRFWTKKSTSPSRPNSCQ